MVKADPGEEGVRFRSFLGALDPGTRKDLGASPSPC